MELYGETVDCAVDVNDFTCDQLSFDQEVDGFNATLTINFSITGEVLTEQSIELAMEAAIASCAGSGCALVGWIVPYPCTMDLEAPATY